MKRLVAAIALAGLALAACGDDDPATTPSTSAMPAPSAPSVTQPETTPSADDTSVTAEPATTDNTNAAELAESTVTIEHHYGATAIDGVPERIVSLDMQWTDVLTALGHPPIAATVDPTMAGWYPWQQIDGVEMIEIGADYAIPFEAVAALEPDLIVGSWGISDQSAYDVLAAVAPTIPLLGDGQVDPWEDMAAVAGQFLDEADAAADLVAEADQAATDLRAELPGLEGKTYALANFVPGDQIYVVADPDDGASQLFAKLGMQIDPELLAQDGENVGRIEVSYERIAELDSDVLLVLTNGTDTAEIIGFNALPAVQSGSFSVLAYAPVVGLNTPTPLSIPYSLDYIRPALEAAAGT